MNRVFRATSSGSVTRTAQGSGVCTGATAGPARGLAPAVADSDEGRGLQAAAKRPSVPTRVSHRQTQPKAPWQPRPFAGRPLR